MDSTVGVVVDDPDRRRGGRTGVPVEEFANDLPEVDPLPESAHPLRDGPDRSTPAGVGIHQVLRIGVSQRTASREVVRVPGDVLALFGPVDLGNVSLLELGRRPG